MKIRNWLHLTMEQQSAIIRSSVESKTGIYAHSAKAARKAIFNMTYYDRLSKPQRDFDKGY